MGDDLEAMTRFVTWDLASSSDATSSMAAALEPTPDLAQNVQADMAAARSALDNPRSSKKSKARRWFSARDESAVEAAIVDDCPLYLREHLDDEVNSSEGCPDLFDVARARAALEKRRDDLANELAANAKLCDTFDEIQ